MKYKVRLEFDVISTDFAEIVVNANTPEKARELASELYPTTDQSLDFWSGGDVDSTLNTDYLKDWEVTKC